MKRYVTGMMTGALVGAVMTGMWLLKRPRVNVYRSAYRQARRWAPKAARVARAGLNMAKRRLG